MKLCEKFLYLPSRSFNDDKNLLEETLISECIRIALFKSEDELHINSLRNWVIRKLRCIIEDISSQDLKVDKFNDVLKEGKGPSMVFVGDVIQLLKGYYIPAPTRVIDLDENKWVLLSGYPTRIFVDLGFSLQIEGMRRIIFNCTKEEIQRQNIPIQSIESYVGLEEILSFNKDYFNHYINHEKMSDWDERVTREVYGGNRETNSWHDFKKCWGLTPFYIEINNKFLSLWREKREFDRFDYWLKIREKIDFGGLEDIDPGSFVYIFKLEIEDKKSLNKIRPTNSIIRQFESNGYPISNKARLNKLTKRSWDIKDLDKLYHINEINEKFWVYLYNESMCGYSEKQIKIQPSDYKLICIALDNLANIPRIVNLIVHNRFTKVSMNFGPPAVVLRWLHTIGARWEGFKNGCIRWKINNYAVEKTEKIINSVGLKVERSDKTNKPHGGV